jgi:hypothetical protein
MDHKKSTGKGKAVPQHTYEGAGGEEYSSYSFTTSALDGSEWSASRLDRAFTPEERTAGTLWTGGKVGPIVGVDTDAREKNPLSLPGIEPRTSGSPVRSQTLH